MKHPLENFPNEYRKRTFFTLLALTLILFGVLYSLAGWMLPKSR